MGMYGYTCIQRHIYTYMPTHVHMHTHRDIRRLRTVHWICRGCELIVDVDGNQSYRETWEWVYSD